MGGLSLTSFRTHPTECILLDRSSVDNLGMVTVFHAATLVSTAWMVTVLFGYSQGLSRFPIKALITLFPSCYYSETCLILWRLYRGGFITQVVFKTGFTIYIYIYIHTLTRVPTVWAFPVHTYGTVGLGYHGCSLGEMHLVP